MSDVSPQLYQRIADLEALVAHLYQQLAVPVPDVGRLRGGAMPAEIVDLVRSGNMIGAIKLHREMFGSSLVEAKQAVEGL
jgi:ribosomal protein L7/L12